MKFSFMSMTMTEKKCKSLIDGSFTNDNLAKVKQIEGMS